MHWLSQVWLVMLIDASIKSLLLAGLASVLLRLTWVRNANVRHRVWTAVLVGMVALPTPVC